MKTAEIMLEGNQKNSRRQVSRKTGNTGTQESSLKWVEGRTENQQMDSPCFSVFFLFPWQEFSSDGGSGTAGEVDAGAGEGAGVGEECDEGADGGRIGIFGKMLHSSELMNS